ncbi:amphi-Trp domain-containing protein [Halobaculum sp. MBLA0143]|uniref:amphi-Trp domain-containing protein n=1 Tax=Halobaculum sp. MBLA0143 TaxID=3079933 RepID=UPI0035233AB2
MSEEVVFEVENERRRADVATILRTIADNLENGTPITLQAGEDAVTLEPPVRPRFGVAVERDGPQDGSKELNVGLELGWSEEGSNEELEVE